LILCFGEKTPLFYRYPEMSVISIIELCIEPAKNLDSGVWNVRFSYMGELYDVITFDTKAFDTKPLYYLIKYNRLDPLIAVKNKNIHDDLIREKTILFY
jgi:hypothetical protein